MKNFHFSLGNSTKGPIGFCARIKADTKEQAVEKLKETLAGAEHGVDIKRACGIDDPDVEYIEAYFNTEAIKSRSIDDWEYIVEEVKDAAKAD